jgi:Ca2+-binding RTX toxin-like protein
MHFSERQRQELSKARKRRLARQHRLAKPSPAFEQLEPRIVLSGSPADPALVLTSAQVAALSSGFTSLSQRLTEAQASDLLASSAAGIGQPLGTLISVGDELRTGLTDPLAVALSGGMNVAQIETAITDAVTADDFLSGVGINTTEATNASGDTVVWFTLSVTGSETLADYELDLGQAGIDGAQGILREQGLAVDAVEVNLDTTLAANFAIGVTLAAGLTANEMICLKSDSIEVGATVSGTVTGIDARFGAIRLGDAAGANISLAVDLGVELDLQEDTDGCLSLGSLDVGAVGDIFSQLDVSTDFDVTIPFDLDISGFDLPTGTGLNITLGSPDLLDASQLNLTLPSLTIGGSPFDFAKLGDFSINDIGSLLDDLSLWIPEIGTGFELPLIGLDVADLFGDAIDLDWDGLFGGLKSPEGEWTFDTLQELDEFFLNSSIGASIGLTWNPNAEAIEWTLPLSFSLTETAGFDSGELIPDGLPLSVAANGELNVTMTGNLSLTAGVAITSSANVNPVNGTTLLTEINGGFGLTTGMLIEGDDLEFTLRDGTVVGVNLGTLDIANGTATVQDLLDLVNTDPQATSNLTLAINASALVATDHTTPASASATFSIAGPSVNVTIGNTPTIQTSLAPIALGLLVAPTTDSEIQGSTLEGFSLRDRLYVKEGEISSLTLAVEGGLEGGAALGPLSLSIYCGAVEGGAGVAVNLVDPGTGAANDGRIYLSEMDAGLDAGNTGVANLMNYSVDSPSLDGIFQLRVTPEELEQTLDIDFAADYLDYCGNVSLSPAITVPDTSLVPYLQLDADLDAEGWSFTIEPSEKLSGVLAGLGDFSLDDLPAMLNFFVSYLEGSGLWDFEIPWIDVSLGDVFGFVEIFANLPEFDLGDLFGRPTGYDPTSGEITWPEFSFGDLGGDFIGSFELALPDLSGLGSFDRLQPLIWTLDDLIVEWEGWTPGDASYDLDFLGRMRAWFSDATLAFPELGGELDLSLAGPAQNFALDFGRLLSLPQFRWEANASAFNANLDASWLGGLNLSGLDFPGLDFGGLDSLEFELGRLFIPESEGGHLPDSLSLPDGINISLTPSLTVDQKFALDLDVTLVDVGYAVDLSALDVADGLALDITAEGNLSLNFSGSVSGRLLVDLSLESNATDWISIDTSNSAINLQASIDDGGGLVLGASLGGLVGLSLGGTGAGQSKATISLSDGAGSPASLTLNAAGELNATAVFDANLPIYTTLTSLGDNGFLGTLGLDATLNLAADPAFDLDLNYEGGSSGYTNITDILLDGDAFFSFDGWLDGAAQFVSFLRTALASDLTADLPLIGGIDVSDGSFIGNLDDFLTTAADIDSPFNLSANLSAEFGSWGAGLSADFGFSLDGVALNSAQMNTSFESLLTADAEFVVDLTLASTTTNTLASADLDFGIESLGLAVEGDADIYLNTSLALNIGLGASLTRGFFIETDEDTEFTAGLSLALPADLSMRLGPLSFDFEDATATDELEANLTVDFGNQSYGLTQLPDLFANINIGGSVRAEVGANLTASLFGESGPGLGVSLAMGFNEEAQAGGSAVSFENLTTNTADKFFFEITDTYIDLGGLLSGPVGELFSQVDTMLEPLRPVLDLLTSDIPVLSDISKLAGGGGITVLDAMRIFGGEEFDSAVTFIETVDQVSDTIATLADVSGTSRVSLGGFTVDDANKASFLGATSAAAGESAINQTAPTANEGQNIAADPANSSVSSTYSGVTEGNLSFPVFVDPAGVLVDLLFGGNPTLVYWDMPDLVAGFTLSQSFPIFPPLFAKFFGGFEFATDFALGYDTRGIRQAMEGGLNAGQMASKMLNGVFLDDVDSGGHDKPELTFTATVGAGAELNVVVAKAGVDAGVRGTLGANLKDNNNDGKVHLDEFVANLRSGPECIFDLEGTIDAFFEAFIKVGVSTPFGFVTLWSDRFELVNVNLFEWNHISCPPVEPSLASLDTSSGVLTLHTGPLAGQVLPGETEDGDEEFLVDFDSAANEYVVIAYDFEERFDGKLVDDIWFDAGIGNDVITFTESVAIPVEGYGGEGNDLLTGGSGPNTFWGDAGSDKLIGRAADDTFHGGDGNDILYGYGGSDTLYGDGGADQLIGDDEAGDLSEAPEGFGGGLPGNDTLRGGADNDVLIAGAKDDDCDGDDGDDTIDGGDGNDTLVGDKGNDRIRGGAGDDDIWGDDVAGVWSAGGIDVNADNIEGGEGYNTIYGGPGYDVIYAISEAVGVQGNSGATKAYPGPVSFVSGSFASFIDGGDGNDSIYGTAGRDYLAGGFEADYIVTGDGGDVVIAGPGNDGVIVAAGDAEVYLGDGNDVVDGGPGNNWIEGGPGDDKIFAREGEDTVYGGSTARSYELRQLDEAHRQVLDPLHGGFSATVAADSCEPVIHFHPEVYPPTPNQVTGTIFVDLNANGKRDTGEPDAPADEVWRLAVIDPDWVHLYEVEQGGGEFTLPADPGLTDGEAVLVVTAKPSDWIATTATVVGLTLPGAGPVDLGFYKLGSITGVVTETGREQGLQEPAQDATIFIDLDEDGDFDTGEPTATANEEGKYTFEDLHPGRYQLFVVPPAGTGCAVVSPRPAVVELTSGQRVEGVSFTIAVNQPPVIEEVLVGSTVNVSSWQSVPDGENQLVPLDLADQITHIALDVCSTGLGTARGNGLLYQLDADGIVRETWSLKFDQTVGNRLIYAIDSVSQPLSLVAGRYVIELADTAIVDATGRKLDGEWDGAPGSYSSGVYFPTGDGTEGGGFQFEFRIDGAGANMMAATATATSGAVATSSTIQGSVWWHDDTSGVIGRTPNEQGLASQKVRLVGQATGITRTATTADVDLNSDGFISFNETGAFQFTNLPPDTYVVSQEPTKPWIQETPGASTKPAELIAVTHDISGGKSSFWTIDSNGLAATFLKDFVGVFAAWDVAAVGHGVVYVAGESLLPIGGGVVTPQTKGGLWQVNLETWAVTDLGPAPSNEIIVSLDTLDADNLLGLTKGGKLVSYNTVTATWTSHGGVFDQVDGSRYYPVGDLAVVSPREIYAILDEEQPNPNGVSSAQLLGRIDLTVSGANTVKLQDLRLVSSRLIGLEVDRNGMLVAFTDKNEFYELPSGGAAVLMGSITSMGLANTGGFAMLPTQLEPDNTVLDFTIQIGAGETVDIGFGNEPDYELLKDGDDLIDGGCGEERDELHGDDVARDGSAPADLELDWWIKTEGGNDRIRGRGGDDLIVGGQQGDFLYGDEGVDEIIGGDTEFNRMLGGDGDDVITGGAARDVALGQAGNDTISTLGGNDSLDGGEDNDVLQGGDDDDTLVGGPGADEVYGQNGSDLLVVIDQSLTLAGPFASPAGAGIVDFYDGGNGNDTLALVDNINLTLTDTDLMAYGETHGVASIEHAYLVGGAGDNTFDAVGFSGSTEMHGQAGNDTLLGGSGVDAIYGGDDDDEISGNDNHDVLDGQAGNDTITGGGGNDTLTGGAGVNTLSGEGGDDTYLFSEVIASDEIDDAGGGSDVADFTAFSSNLTLSVGNFSAPIRVEQRSLFNAVFLTDKIETVLLGSGADTLVIKDGSSTIASVDAGSGTDLLTYQGGTSGWAAWTTSVKIDLAAGTATGFGATLNVEDASGGDGDDLLVGSNVDNRLLGYGGNDTISGGGGNDTLAGGSGVNNLAGEDGNDTYQFSQVVASDIVDDAGSGVDVADFTAFSTNLTLAVGNASAPILVTQGSSFQAAFVVTDQIESVLLGTGNDTLEIKEGSSTIASVDAGNGTDLLSYQGAVSGWAAWTSGVNVSLAAGTATGFGATLNVEDASGGDGDDSLTGSSVANRLAGFGGNDTLVGLGGNDTLIGGAGNDTMSGGFGDDVYSFADLFGDDTINEVAGEGTADTMDFSAVTVPLEVLLGSVTVSDGTSTATHASDHIEEVIGGAADDAFVMTGPSVVFPGTLDGGGGTNTLWYDDPDAAIVAAVEGDETPNVDSAINFAAVNAIEWQENAALSGPVLLGTDYDGEVYVNPATPVTYVGSKVTTSVIGGRFELLEAETVTVPGTGTGSGPQNVLFARDTTGGHLVRLPASAAWAMFGLFGISPASTPVLVKPSATPAGSPLQLPVELNGAINLRRDELAQLAIDDGITLTALSKDGDRVTQTSNPGYRMVAAEQVGGVNQLLLIAATGDGLIWSFDASWVWTGKTTFTAGSADADQAESDFELDIDLDGSIG